MREPTDARQNARAHFRRAQSVADMIPMMPPENRDEAVVEVLDDLRAGLDVLIEEDRRRPGPARHISENLRTVLGDLDAA